MIKNKLSLTLKLFIIVWVVLFIHVLLKLTFNYWQPYVIPNDQLQAISDFIDNNRWIRDVLDGILYTFNGIVVILTSLQIWWFKNKKQSIIVISLIILGFITSLIFKDSTINTLILSIVVPLIINKNKWLTIILTFLLNNVFIILSLWLCNISNLDNTQYIIQTLFVLDYYIMMIICCFVFNFIREKKEKK